jgi:hypothetical protein
MYDANSLVFSASLTEPIDKAEVKQGFIELPQTGGYEFAQVPPLQLKGVASHGGGYSQVAGHPNSDGTGAVTLATAVVENINVLDILTADRVVGQITTELAFDGSVPSVSFIGTRFDNLRIAGEPIDIEPHLDILGPKPNNDESYFNDPGVFSRIVHQYSNIKRMVGLPKWASDQFSWDPTEVQREHRMNLSLVNSVSGAPGKSFGHVIDLPFFGKIFLGELMITREPINAGPRLETAVATQRYSYRFTLTMIRTEMNGSVNGRMLFAKPDPNGQGLPPPPAPPAPPASPSRKNP